jgi:hypothetical protein
MLLATVRLPGFQPDHGNTNAAERLYSAPAALCFGGSILRQTTPPCGTPCKGEAAGGGREESFPPQIVNGRAAASLLHWPEFEMASGQRNGPSAIGGTR